MLNIDEINKSFPNKDIQISPHGNYEKVDGANVIVTRFNCLLINNVNKYVHECVGGLWIESSLAHNSLTELCQNNNLEYEKIVSASKHNYIISNIYVESLYDNETQLDIRFKIIKNLLKIAIKADIRHLTLLVDDTMLDYMKFLGVDFTTIHLKKNNIELREDYSDDIIIDFPLTTNTLEIFVNKYQERSKELIIKEIYHILAPSTKVKIMKNTLLLGEFDIDKKGKYEFNIQLDSKGGTFFFLKAEKGSSLITNDNMFVSKRIEFPHEIFSMKRTDFIHQMIVSFMDEREKLNHCN